MKTTVKEEVSKALIKAANILEKKARVISAATPMMRKTVLVPWPMESDGFSGDFYNKGEVKNDDGSLGTAVYSDDQGTIVVLFFTETGTYSMEAAGMKKSGKWSDIKDISTTLKLAKKWAKKNFDARAKAIEKLGGATWQVKLDGDSAMATYKGKRKDGSPAEIYVRFDDGMQSEFFRGTAEIVYKTDKKYQGGYGTTTEREGWDSFIGIKKVLKQAEGTFKMKEGI